MPHATLNGIQLHYLDEGPKEAPTLVFANSLGTDLHMWDPILPYLPKTLRLIRYDKRGHGKSEVPDAPYTMGALIKDAEALLDHLHVRNCVFVGLSIGGMIAQGLATKRLDLIHAMVLSNTAAKIGTPNMWAERIAALQNDGLEGMADTVMQRWFSRDFLALDQLQHWRDMLTAQSPEGYIGCCHAIAGTDFYTPTSALRLPTLGIAGSEDGATPPDLVRETINLIPGSQFTLMHRVGHLPCVEQPENYAGHVTEFLKQTGHI